MQLENYPIKAHSNPDGEMYIGGPKPASHIWRIDYVDSNGYAKWIFYRGELSNPVAELPIEEIRIMEKRMEKPHRITSVKFGLIYHQEEPKGPWVRFDPNDKDPRAKLYYEGNYTELYFSTWRKAAYNGHFDPFKLTRAFSEKESARQNLEAKERYAKELEDRLAAERLKNEQLLENNKALLEEAKVRKAK